jgi:hypothetical protein
MPGARYAEVPGAYVLSMLDEPEAVTRELGEFLTSTGGDHRPPDLELPAEGDRRAFTCAGIPWYAETSTGSVSTLRPHDRPVPAPGRMSC